MEPWNYQPAKDLDLPPRERHRSLRRESGLWSSMGHLFWHTMVKTYLKGYHRLRVEGIGNLPATPPFILIANHSSHLDAMILGASLSSQHRDCVFPVAAGDVFFETPARSFFSAQLLNALPMWRRNCGPHALADLKRRLVEEPCGYILFPEGGRSRDGQMMRFKAGLGMIVAGTAVPVVPCGIVGALAALPPGAYLPRPRGLTLKIGPPLAFEGVPNAREGWEKIARDTEAAVRGLTV